MKTLYIDCMSGISGDMLTAALIDAGVPLALLQETVDSLELKDVQLEAREVRRRGFRAVQFIVNHPEQKVHRHLSDIEQIIRRANLDERQREQCLEVFRRLAQAEAYVHGSSIEKVHFHEVGAIDSIVDIVAAVVGLSSLGVQRVECSPIPTGTGTIEIAHGTVTVPAPATAQLLTGVPLRRSAVAAELTTPTGAALATTFATAFGPLPAMTIERTGYGAGSRDLSEQANVLRILLGQSIESNTFQHEVLYVVEAHVDDATGQMVGECCEHLLQAGVADVYCTPVMMKKGRPGTLVTVFCPPAVLPVVQRALVERTGTLGVRYWPVERQILARWIAEAETRFGKVIGKQIQMPDGSLRFVPEFDDCRRIAAELNTAPGEVWTAACASGEIVRVKVAFADKPQQ